MTDIKTLTDRFFAGETTREEEQQLYRAFRDGEVPQELEYLRGMFEGLGEALSPVTFPKRAGERNSRKWVWWAAVGAAACWVVIALPPCPSLIGRGEITQMVGQSDVNHVVVNPPLRDDGRMQYAPTVADSSFTHQPTVVDCTLEDRTCPSPEAIERAQRLLEEQRMMAMVEEALESEEVQKIIEEYSRDIIYTVSL